MSLNTTRIAGCLSLLGHVKSHASRIKHKPSRVEMIMKIATVSPLSGLCAAASIAAFTACGADVAADTASAQHSGVTGEGEGEGTIQQPLAVGDPDTPHRFKQEFAYNANGDLIMRKFGTTTERFIFDRNQHRNQTILSTDAVEISTALLDIDMRDRMVGFVDARGLRTSIEVTPRRERIREVSPDRGTIMRQFMPDGRLVAVTDAGGHRVAYVFDDNARIHQVLADDSVVRTYTYATALDGAATEGRVARIDDAVGETRFYYDAFGRNTLTTINTVTGHTYRFNRSYGLTGPETNKVTSLQYPSGALVRMSYGAAGQLQALSLVRINSDTTETNTPIATSVTYAPNGDAAGFVWGDGRQWSRTWHQGDLQGALRSYSLGDVVRELDYDDRGNIVRYAHTGTSTAATADRALRYDANHALLAVEGTHSYTYEYDVVGNRLVTIVDGVAANHTYATDSNRMRTSQQAAAADLTASWAFDAAGLATRVRDMALVYDATGRLSSVAHDDGRSAAFVYDAAGHRVRDTGTAVPGGEIERVYDQGHLLGEYQNGVPLYEVVWINDQPLAVLHHSENQTVIDYIYPDHNNTPTLIVSSGSHLPLWQFDPIDGFGATGVNSNPSGTGEYLFNLRFPGQIHSAATGLIDNHHRDYDPLTGRYLQADPRGIEGGTNLFLYVGNNPIQGTDPLGLDPWASDPSLKDIPYSQKEVCRLLKRAQQDEYGLANYLRTQRNPIGKNSVSNDIHDPNMVSAERYAEAYEGDIDPILVTGQFVVKHTRNTLNLLGLPPVLGRNGSRIETASQSTGWGYLGSLDRWRGKPIGGDRCECLAND